MTTNTRTPKQIGESMFKFKIGDLVELNPASPVAISIDTFHGTIIRKTDGVCTIAEDLNNPYNFKLSHQNHLRPYKGTKP